MGIDSHSFGRGDWSGRGRKPIVRQQRRIDRPRQCDGTDVAGAGFSQRLGAFIERGAGCQHVVHEENPARSHGIGPSNMKGPAEVGQAGRSGQRRLRGIVTDSDQIGIAEGDFQPSPDCVGQEQRLIEFPLAEPYRIKIVKATDQTNIAAYSADMPEDKFKKETLELINALYPNKKPKPGQLFKIVE